MASNKFIRRLTTEPTDTHSSPRLNTGAEARVGLNLSAKRRREMRPFKYLSDTDDQRSLIDKQQAVDEAVRGIRRSQPLYAKDIVMPPLIDSGSQGIV